MQLSADVLENVDRVTEEEREHRWRPDWMTLRIGYYEMCVEEPDGISMSELDPVWYESNVCFSIHGYGNPHEPYEQYRWKLNTHPGIVRIRKELEVAFGASVDLYGHWNAG